MSDIGHNPSAASGVAGTSAKQVVHTDSAPAAVGPYSQAIRAGSLVFTAGQLGIDPDGGRLVAGGVASETRQALSNLRAILSASGAGLENIVKTTVYLTELADFQSMNEVYATFFGSEPPARATVAVSSLPLNSRVQIEAVAVVTEPVE